MVGLLSGVEQGLAFCSSTQQCDVLANSGGNFLTGWPPTFFFFSLLYVNTALNAVSGDVCNQPALAKEAVFIIRPVKKGLPSKVTWATSYIRKNISYAIGNLWLSPWAVYQYFIPSP